MANNEETGNPRWSASFFMQTTEDVARAVAAAAAAATANRSQRPSAVFSSKEDDGGSPIQKMQRQVTRVLKGFSQPPEVKSASYNPEILTSQKRQWASFQSQYLGHKSLMEPTRLFESMVVVGLHPNCDIQALYRQFIARKHKGSGRLRSALSCQNQSRVEPNLEPQVLFAYPSEKEVPLKYKDLLSFCLPGGMEVHAIERTPSMSELNEILVGQEHLKQTDLSFVFRLQVADDSTMYGCCVLVEEPVQKPSGLLSMISDKQPSGPSLSRHILTTRRCYCILSRFPFFQLHFGVLNSILTEERLERLTQGILLNLESPEDCWRTERLEENVGTDSDGVSLNHRDEENMMDRMPEISKLSIGECKREEVTANGSHEEHQMLNGDFCLSKKGINDNVFNSLDPDSETVTAKRESSDTNCEDCDMNANDCLGNKKVVERCPPNAVLPLLPYCQCESSESSSSILTEERLERLTQGILLNLESPEDCWRTERLEENVGTDSDGVSLNHRDEENMMDRMPEISKLSIGECKREEVTANGSHEEHQMLNGDFCLSKKGINDNVFNSLDPDSETVTAKRESSDTNCEDCDMNANDCLGNKKVVERCPPNAVLPLLPYCQCESSESSSSFQGSPSEERNFRSDVDDTETEEVSFSGQEAPSDVIDILEWAKANNNGSLKIICEYYRLHCPGKGSTVRFHPLEHLHPLEFYRPDEIVLHFAGSTIDLRSRSMSLGFAEAHSALLAEEEATALSVWAVACICGSLRLENVLTLFAGALLERQIVVVCSNLGILSACVLSIIPLIRPYQWQSLLMPVLPNDMLDFLDAPVPYIVGVKNKTNEVQSKLTNAILVDINKNQVKSSSIPQLPQQKELLSSLSPYYAKLVGESYLGKKRPVYECTDVQAEAAKGFLVVLRSYLDCLCSKLRSHTITNVQSNDDKVSLLLKESFIDSFSNRDRPFMKHFVDTQLFSVHTDLVLSLFQKE
ncbi:hypothetical protein I3842_04G142400 [Carya illinoinensis]|uniref:UDENN domain-containing protein n=1 Tax=Carya illinoinensis TaxID=32201 RepID=A0A922FAA6_CARIL|nr:hypothetical protein I3842_04G142400 [Carya illinoinensis]KAG6718289.1 hypothetical protein I3842_04G142400 [Carya illinoinensis]